MNKKQLGIYYTPSDATRILCQWAIQTPDDFVLEPSFGACGFLEASRDRLNELNSDDPNSQLFGCDVDDRAFTDFLRPKFSRPDLLERFKHNDFMKITPEDFPVRAFDVVIGNPPYISYHNMTHKQRSAVFAAIKASQFPISCKASLWAYFVVHGLRFLRRGGRVAWILPSSFLHAEYSSTVREIISKGFKRSLVIQLGERLFSSEGTDESTAILLAEGWDESLSDGAELKVEFAPKLENLEQTIFSWQNGGQVGQSYNKPIGHALVSPAVTDCLQEVEYAAHPTTFGSIANIIIGIVTGANDFFIINREVAQLWQLPEKALRPVFSKFKMADGISLRKGDVNRSIRENFRCLLVDTAVTTDADEDLALRVYLWSFSEDEKHRNKTFKKRAVWHQPDDQRMPDGFLSYMLQNGPRLVLNSARTTCTNTVHRVFFRPHVSALQRKAAAISMISTFSQLSAELEGRSYGSGALKIEPSEARRIKIILPQDTTLECVEETFKKVDVLLREGQSERAKNVADRFVMSGFSQRSRISVLKLLTDALYHARARRFTSKVATD